MRTKGITMHDIAIAAGVSQSTVSMILNNKSNSFPDSTIKKVMKAATELNYKFRNPINFHNSNTILVICSQATNPYYTIMIQSIECAAMLQNINVLTACTYHDSSIENAYLQLALTQRFLGIIFLYPPDNENAFVSAYTQIPIVTICDRSNNVKGDIVELNNFEAGVLAADHLLSLGHTNIAVLTHHISNHSTTSCTTRVMGVLSEVRKVVSEDHLLVLTSNNNRFRSLKDKDFYYELGYSLAQNKKLYQGNISGIVCQNDLLAYGVMDALLEKGYKIPSDFSIIGSDNLIFSNMSRISLTTIELHLDIVAQSALSTLLNRTNMTITSQSLSSPARFYVQCQPNLIIRNSTGPAHI